MNRPIVLFTFFLLMHNIPILSQENGHHKLNISVSSGFVKITSTDQLLNYFIYSGKPLLPFHLDGSYSYHNNLFIVDLNYCNAKLYAKNLNTAFYEYNYMKNWYTGLNIEYFRYIVTINKHVRIFGGIANNAYLVIQKESFKNLLYDYAEGYRKSYDFTCINLSPDLLIDCNVNKHSVGIKTGYTLFALAARPDDNYVKQIDIKNELTWKSYFPKSYKGFNFVILYLFRLSKSISITAEYNVLYHSYFSDEYKYLQQSYLIGISKKL